MTPLRSSARPLFWVPALYWFLAKLIISGIPMVFWLWQCDTTQNSTIIAVTLLNTPLFKNGQAIFVQGVRSQGIHCIAAKKRLMEGGKWWALSPVREPLRHPYGSNQMPTELKIRQNGSMKYGKQGIRQA
jgi:hypothetical protein